MLSVIAICIAQLVYSQDTCLTGDCENGIGKLLCECGYTYEGEFKDGQKVHGKLTKKELTYEGDFKDDMAHGQGKITYKDGSWYEGRFAYSQPDGEGVYHLTNGFVYKGQLAAGDFKGWGDKLKVVVDSVAVDRFTGWFSEDELNGVGLRMYPTGTYEIGQFQKNKLHGLGAIVHPTGGVEIGKYKKGKLVEEYALEEQRVVQLVKELDETELVVKSDSENMHIGERLISTEEAFQWFIQFNTEVLEFQSGEQQYKLEL